MACEHHHALVPDTPRFWDDLEQALRRSTRPRRWWRGVAWLRTPRTLSGYLAHTVLALSLWSAVLAVSPELLRAPPVPSTTTVAAAAPALRAPRPTNLDEARALARARGHDMVVVRAIVEDRADDGRVLAFSRAQTIQEDVGHSRAPVVVVVGFAASPALRY